MKPVLVKGVHTYAFSKWAFGPFFNAIESLNCHLKTGAASGKSPGFGMTLTAETTTGTFLSADVCSQPKSEQGSGGGDPSVPEELAELCAKRLLEEIYRQVNHLFYVDHCALFNVFMTQSKWNGLAKLLVAT